MGPSNGGCKTKVFKVVMEKIVIVFLYAAMLKNRQLSLDISWLAITVAHYFSRDLKESTT